MYELMVVANPSEDAEGFVKKLEGFLTEAKASNLNVERLGKKPLAYQIAKQNEGEYVLFTFEAPSEAPSTLVGKIKLEQNAVLRYMIVKSKATKAKKGVITENAESKSDDTEKSAAAKAMEDKKVAKVEVKAKAVRAEKLTQKSVKVKGKKK